MYNDYTTRTPGCVTAMVKDIGWESLVVRRYIARLSLLYKIQHRLVEVDTSSCLQQEDSRTQCSSGFFQERINREVYLNSFFPRTIQEWNHLPEDVTVAASLEVFRASLTNRLAHYPDPCHSKTRPDCIYRFSLFLTTVLGLCCFCQS